MTGGHCCFYYSQRHNYISSCRISRRRDKVPQISRFEFRSQLLDSMPAVVFLGANIGKTWVPLYSSAFVQSFYSSEAFSHPFYNFFIRFTLWVRWVWFSPFLLKETDLRSPSWTVSRSPTRNQLSWLPTHGAFSIWKWAQGPMSWRGRGERGML